MGETLPMQEAAVNWHSQKDAFNIPAVCRFGGGLGALLLIGNTK